MNTGGLPLVGACSPRPSPPREEEREAGRGARVSACPFGAAVCADWRRREAGLCLDCWAGVVERANAVSPWLRSA
jgi:hypothetical protein